jgi:hypothetical protein
MSLFPLVFPFPFCFFHFKPINYAVGPVASIYRRHAFPNEYDAADEDNQAGQAGADYPSSTLPVSSLPTQFLQLEFTMRTYQLMDGTFSVSKALEANPSLIYSIPSLWMNTYSQDVTIDASGKGSLNINSVPAGMIQSMIIRARPVNATSYQAYDIGAITNAGASDTVFRGDYQSKLNYDPPAFNSQVIRPAGTNNQAGASAKQTGVTPAYRPYIPWSIPFRSVNLQYSGQSIYNAKTPESHDGFIRSIFKDDLKTDICGLPLTQSVVGQISAETSGTLAGPPVLERVRVISEVVNLGNDAMVDHETQVIVIPLMHDGDSIFRHRAFENLPHYSGSTLQLDFSIEKNNFYRSRGLNRQLCYQDGTQLKPNTLNYSKSQVFQRFQNTTGWASENDSSGCARYPSNRLQHVALSTGPRGTSAPSNAGNIGRPEINHERVLFNNNPSSEGSTAWSEGGNIDNLAAGVTAGGVVRLDITYVVASLFQVTNGVAELQL